MTLRATATTLFFALATLPLPSAAFADGAVTIRGCAVPGVEAGCLVLHDETSRQTYDITNASPAPSPANGEIMLSGTRSDKMTFCMQGIILEGIRWSATGRPCPK